MKLLLACGLSIDVKKTSIRFGDGFAYCRDGQVLVWRKMAHISFFLEMGAYTLSVYLEDGLWRANGVLHKIDIEHCLRCQERAWHGTVCSGFQESQGEVLRALVRHKDVRLACATKLKPLA